MNCSEAKLQLSEYLDGTLTGAQMHAIAAHLRECPNCESEFELLKQTNHMVAELGRKPAPADLALRLRVMASHELARSRSNWFARAYFRLEDALNPLMFPATAGVLTAILFFGVLIGFFALPTQLSAADTTFYTPPELQATSPFVNNMPGDSAIVVDALVDARGRVQEYHVISAPPGAEDLTPELNNIMIFTTFRPATAFGQPTTGRVVLSFSRINVKG